MEKDNYNIHQPEVDHWIINLSPIWIFSSFMEKVLRESPDIKKNLKGIISCSSTSALTKKYSFSNFDKNLSKNSIVQSKNLYMYVQKTKFFKIHNKLFFLLAAPLLLLDEVIFASILRINSNLSGFTKASEFCKSSQKEFPIKF